MIKIKHLQTGREPATRVISRASAILCAVLALALSSCNPFVPTAVPAPTNAPQSPTPVNLPPTASSPALVSPLALPTSFSAAPTIRPPVPAASATATPFVAGTPRAPARGTGVVIGRAVVPPGQARHPSFIVAGELYLGSLVPAADPKLPPAISVSPIDAPHALVDQKSGAFVFYDVKPGTYALAMVGYSQSYVLEGLKGGRVEVMVDANKTTDLGDVTLK